MSDVVRGVKNEKVARKVKAGRVKTDKRTRTRAVLDYARAIGSAILIALVIKQFAFQAFRIPTGSMKNTLLIGDFLFVNKFLYGAKSPERLRVFGKTLASDLPMLRLPAIREPRQGDIIVFQYPLDLDLDYIKRCVAVAGDLVAVRDGVLHVNGQVYESNFADRDGDHSCVPDWRQPDVCDEPRTLREPYGARSRLNQTYGLTEALQQAWRNRPQQFVPFVDAALAKNVFPDPEQVRQHLTAVRRHLEGGGVLNSPALRLHAEAILGAAGADEVEFVVPEGHLFMMGDNRFNSQDSRYWGPLDVDLIKGKALFIYLSLDFDKNWPRFSRIGDIIR